MLDDPAVHYMNNNVNSINWRGEILDHLVDPISWVCEPNNICTFNVLTFIFKCILTKFIKVFFCNNERLRVMLSLVSSNSALAYLELVNQSQYQDTLQHLNSRRNKSGSSEVMFPIIVSHLDTHSMGPRVGNDSVLVSWTTLGFGWDYISNRCSPGTCFSVLSPPFPSFLFLQLLFHVACLRSLRSATFTLRGG